MEQITIVNENDIPVKGCVKTDIHEKGLLHREVYVYFVNKNGILVQLRRSGLLDHSVGGHVRWKETYVQAAIRETKEELGIDIQKKELLFFRHKHLHSEGNGMINNRFVKVFLCFKEVGIKELKPNYDEVGLLVYMNKTDIFNTTIKKTPSFKEIVLEVIQYINKMGK